MLHAWHAAWLHTFLILAAVFALVPGQALANDEHPGKAIYTKLCASCHGDAGQGTTENYPEALAGDRPLVDLARVITETMPEGEADVPKRLHQIPQHLLQLALARRDQ